MAEIYTAEQMRHHTVNFDTVSIIDKEIMPKMLKAASEGKTSITLKYYGNNPMVEIMMAVMTYLKINYGYTTKYRASYGRLCQEVEHCYIISWKD